MLCWGSFWLSTKKPTAPRWKDGFFLKSNNLSFGAYLEPCWWATVTMVTVWDYWRVWAEFCLISVRVWVPHLGLMVFIVGPFQLPDHHHLIWSGTDGHTAINREEAISRMDVLVIKTLTVQTHQTSQTVRQVLTHVLAAFSDYNHDSKYRNTCSYNFHI